MFLDVEAKLGLDEVKGGDHLLVGIVEDGQTGCGAFLIHHFIAKGLQEKK